MYKTINLKPDTYYLLEEFKYMGLSYDQVIKILLETISIDEFYQRVKENRDKLKERGVDE